MIFGTVGSTRIYPFDRLVRALDRWAEETGEEVQAQIGCAAYEPRHAKWFRFSDAALVERLTAQARVVVCHDGAGSILTALDAGVPTVVVRRRKEHGECVLSANSEFAEALARRGAVAVVEADGILDALRSPPAPPRTGERRARFLQEIQTLVLEYDRRRPPGGPFPK